MLRAVHREKIYSLHFRIVQCAVRTFALSLCLELTLNNDECHERTALASAMQRTDFKLAIDDYL